MAGTKKTKKVKLDPLILDVNDFAIVVSDVGVLPTVSPVAKPKTEFMLEFDGEPGDEFIVDKTQDQETRRSITKIYVLREEKLMVPKTRIPIVKITKPI